MDNSQIVKMLEWPEGKVDVVFDSDTFNEIDDQYALAYMLRSSHKLNVKAFYAAPFYKFTPPFDKMKPFKSKSPGDGMEKSYQEIMNVLTLMGEEEQKEKVYRGSEKYLPSETEAVVSDAAEDLAQRAMQYSPEHPLYVIAIAAITNVASALLLNPEIKDRIVVIWLGGNALEWPNNLEFNLVQDVAAARVLFSSGVPVVLLPCRGVVSSFTVSAPELDYWMKGKNKLCDYLVEATKEYAAARGCLPTWQKPVWDVAAVGWLLDRGFMMDRYEISPIPTYDFHYAFDKSRHLIKYVYHIHSDALLLDMFHKLTK